MTNQIRFPFNRKKIQGRFEIRAEKDKDESTIYLYDQIGVDWFGEGVSALDFVKELSGVTSSLIHLRINSPGGDVFEARAIQTALREHSSLVVAHIDGLAASAATYVALGADEIEMAEGAFFMIHNAWGLTVGNSTEMRAMADMLDKMDASIRTDYMAKTGKKEEEISQMMAAETWMTAQEALDNGFIDRIAKDKKAKNQWDLTIYDKVPPELLTKDEEKDEEKHGFDLKMMERRLNLIRKLA